MTLLAFCDARLQELSHQRRRQWRVEVKRGLRPLELRDLLRQRRECAAAERIVGPAAAARCEACHDAPLETERRDIVADAFLRLRDFGADGLAQLLQERALPGGNFGEVGGDWVAGHAATYSARAGRAARQA